MADNSNKKIFDEDGSNYGSNYDRIQDLLTNVVSTKEKAKVAIGVSKKKKFVSPNLSRYPKKVKLVVNQI